MKILITGSNGLIGGEAVEYFDSQGHTVIGLDNNMRREFFGPAGDTLWNMNRIFHKSKNFTPMPVDIRDEGQLHNVFMTKGPFDVIIHCAAQPSHDKAKEIPLVDHSVNAFGTLLLLEMTRRHSPNATFIFTSTNKVYGDAPNKWHFDEYETRYDYKYEGTDRWWNGVNEDLSIDQNCHSIFGANKAAADLMVQEYAHTYGMNTVVLRGGCLTGPSHSGVELHGFLSYLVKCIFTGKPYTIYGFKGKQVRDNIHSKDVILAMEQIIKAPRRGEVYNIGGGRDNSISVLEAVNLIEKKFDKKGKISYNETARLGDHICYITNMSKFKYHYPDWRITYSINQIIDEMIERAYWDDHTEHEFTLDYTLNQNSLVMDVGGYRGTWSADIDEKYKCNILIFEPVHEFNRHCSARFSECPKIKVFNFGLSDKDERVKITKQGINTSIFRGAEGQIPMPDATIFGSVTSEDIILKDISEFLTEKNISYVDLLNINCEGGEFAILDRLIQTGLITRFKNVQIQFHDFYPNAQDRRKEIRERLSLTHQNKFCYDWIWESWERK